MNLSVVVPTFNRRHIVGNAIDSALAQTLPPLEVIVVDDGSSDGTPEWLAERYGEQPVRLLRNAGAKGPAGARNTGLQAARGDFIALLDSDDAFLPDHLAEAQRAFERQDELDVVFGRARYERNGQPEDYMGPNFERKLAQAPMISRDNELVCFGPSFFEHLLRYGCWFNLSSVVMRRAAIGDGMNETLRISEDYEYWVRLARTKRFGCLLAPQIRYTLHADNISFEADSSAAAHAPRLLQALAVMRSYDGIGRGERALIDAQRSSILFDWAHRCRQRREWGESARLHWASLRAGQRTRNALALAKLPLSMVGLRRSG